VAGLAVRIVIIALVVAGGILFRDRITGGAADLKAGDCFDHKQETEIKKVQHHPCNEAHTAEVVLVTNYPAPKGAPYPTDASLDTWGDNTCVPAIMSYVTSEADLMTLNYGIYVPRDRDWNDGERQMICYAIRDDLGPMTKSLSAAHS
jgi:Septum formation